MYLSGENYIITYVVTYITLGHLNFQAIWNITAKCTPLGGSSKFLAYATRRCKLNWNTGPLLRLLACWTFTSPSANTVCTFRRIAMKLTTTFSSEKRTREPEPGEMEMEPTTLLSTILNKEEPTFSTGFN